MGALFDGVECEQKCQSQNNNKKKNKTLTNKQPKCDSFTIAKNGNKLYFVRHILTASCTNNGSYFQGKKYDIITLAPPFDSHTHSLITNQKSQTQIPYEKFVVNS